MGVYTIETPDGRRLDIEADSQDAAVAGAKDWVSQNPTEAQKADAQVANETGFGDRFRRFTDLVADPLHLSDEIRGIGAAAREYVTGAGARKSGNPSVWNSAGEAYTQASEKAKAERRAAAEANEPTVGGVQIPAWQIAGGLATTGPGTIAQALPQGYLQGLKQSVGIGAGFGGAAGFGQAEGGPLERLEGTLEGAGTGAIVAPALSHVVIPGAGRFVGKVNDAFRYGNSALRSFSNPEQVAVENVADRMVDTGLAPAAVRSAISPNPSNNLASRGFTPADMADIISRQKAGESADTVAADYAHLVDSQGRAPTGATMRRYLQTYDTDNPTPLNIIDLAKETAGEGGAAPITRLGRAAYSLSGDESGGPAQALMGRQETQPGRVSNIIQRSVAGGDFEATRTAGLKNLQNEAKSAYKQFYAEPDLAINELGDLMEDPLFRQATMQAQQQARIEVIRRNQAAKRAGQPLEAVPSVEPDNQVFSPEMLDLIQRQLRIRSEGFASDPNAARHARSLREVFLDRIEDHYPTFGDIRRNYATGMGEFGEEGALESGRELTTKLGAKTSEALRDYHTMTPAQQELYRLGFARRLMDNAADPQIGGAVANKFTTSAVREIVEELYPRTNPELWKQGQRLLRDLRREAITTRTKNDVLAGSRTAELNSDMSRLTEGAQAAADVATGRWLRVVQNLSTRLTTQLGREGAAATMRILTETDPAKLLPLLNQLETAARTTAARRARVTGVRQLRALAAPNIAQQTGLNEERVRGLLP